LTISGYLYLSEDGEDGYFAEAIERLLYRVGGISIFVKALGFFSEALLWPSSPTTTLSLWLSSHAAAAASSRRSKTNPMPLVLPASPLPLLLSHHQLIAPVVQPLPPLSLSRVAPNVRLSVGAIAMNSTKRISRMLSMTLRMK
jgi:hypothetical protein